MAIVGERSRYILVAIPKNGEAPVKIASSQLLFVLQEMMEKIQKKEVVSLEGEDQVDVESLSKIFIIQERIVWQEIKRKSLSSEGRIGFSSRP